MKKQDPIQRLWHLKRRHKNDTPATSSADNATTPTLPPGLATRIAARWAAGADRPSATVLWERVTAGTLVASLLLCGGAAWMRPKPPPAKDLMLSLFTARPAPDDGFPF